MKKIFPQDFSAVDMVPVASGLKHDVNVRIQKVLKETDIYLRAYKKVA